MKRIPPKAISFSRNPFNGVLMSRSVSLWYFNRNYHVFRNSSVFTHKF